MGQCNPISAVSNALDSAVSAIADAASDVGQVVTQISGIATQLAGLTPDRSLARRYLAAVGAAQDVDGAVKQAMAGAKAAATSTFSAQYPSSTLAGSDSGMIASFDSTQDVGPIVNQISTNFSNWSMPVNGDQIRAMAETIQEEYNAKGGATGASYGHYNLTMNESVQWAVAYGAFQVNSNQTGLIYGFAATLDSGWGADAKP